VAEIRSTDGGTTWSQPIIVAPQDVGTVRIAGHEVRSSDELPEFAVGPDGNIYAVWQDARFNGTTSKIAFSMSTDGGLTWSSPIEIDQAPENIPAFTPQIHVTGGGVIGVVYYDLESATASTPGLTDTFVVHCPSACDKRASWTTGGETKLDTTGPFDMTTAPDAEGYFVGDYDGLTSTGSTFDPFFVMAKPQATAGRTAVSRTPASGSSPRGAEPGPRVKGGRGSSLATTPSGSDSGCRPGAVSCSRPPARRAREGSSRTRRASRARGRPRGR